MLISLFFDNLQTTTRETVIDEKKNDQTPYIRHNVYIFLLKLQVLILINSKAYINLS